jgi:CheY-like chemotaxis protein
MASRVRVLVAEDDAMLREILEEGLSAEGFEVVAAADGAEAFELYRTAGPFHALLLDEEMPRLTGRDQLGRIRAAGDDVPALLVSGNLVLTSREQAALGIGPVLRKPVSIELLARAIRDAVARLP